MDEYSKFEIESKLVISSLLKEKRYEERNLYMVKRQEYFWQNIYPIQSKDWKIKYWAGGIGRQMRWNGESGFKEESALSTNDYEYMKEKEPMIDDFLLQIAKKMRCK